MGVSWVFPLPEMASRPGPQAVDELKRHLELLGAQRSGQYSVDSEPYYPKQDLKTIHLCHASDYPSSTFALVAETPGSGASVVADTMFDQLMAKLSNAYATRPQSKIECRGSKYELGDFLVKVGAVTLGASFKGVLIEVEYGPCQIPSLCNELMKEFCDGLLTSTTSTSVSSGIGTSASSITSSPPTYILNHFKPGQAFRPIDVVNQYMELFHQYRRIVGATPGTRP